MDVVALILDPPPPPCTILGRIPSCDEYGLIIASEPGTSALLVSLLLCSKMLLGISNS